LAEKADIITGLILPKLVANSGLELHTFREIVEAMDPDEGLLTQH
jgi:hypothetical protein